MMARQLTNDDRILFGAFADHLIPAYKKMPKATDVGVAADLLDAVLGFRPDLREGFFRGLDAIRDLPAAEAAERLFKSDNPTFEILGLVASGGYYMAPEVRDLMGYPGQESLSYDPHAPQDYVTSGLLDRVVKRGPIYVATPV
jgi:hypothetical protein